jgi:hypothetical protein
MRYPMGRTLVVMGGVVVVVLAGCVYVQAAS